MKVDYYFFIFDDNTWKFKNINFIKPDAHKEMFDIYYTDLPNYDDISNQIIKYNNICIYAFTADKKSPYYEFDWKTKKWIITPYFTIV
jgi:hypothetical protein